VLLGLVAGYFQGTLIEAVIMRIVDIFLALPPLVLALAVSAVLRPTLFQLDDGCIFCMVGMVYPRIIWPCNIYTK
jgi:ABC-type dipeptide/oligopeptide/nickel transport system permease subunit